MSGDSDDEEDKDEEEESVQDDDEQDVTEKNHTRLFNDALSQSQQKTTRSCCVETYAVYHQVQRVIRR